jgi:hypothetical protein
MLNRIFAKLKKEPPKEQWIIKNPKGTFYTSTASDFHVDSQAKMIELFKITHDAWVTWNMLEQAGYQCVKIGIPASIRRDNAQKP